MSKKLILLFVLLPFVAFAQQGNVPLNDQWMTETEAEMVRSKGYRFPTHLLRYEADSVLHVLITNEDSLQPLEEPTLVAWPTQTSFRPLIEQGHGLRQYYIAHNNGDFAHNKRGRQGFSRWIYGYHTKNSLLQVEKPAQGDIPLFRLYIDPLLNLQYMSALSDTSSETLYTNGRGIIARGDIGTKVSFETSFWENQAFLPMYQDSFAWQYGVIPGMGRWKPFKTTGYDYAMASGHLSWSPSSFFNVQVGHGKHFIGDGVRSLLLSDNSFNYPYARFTGWFGKNKNMQYTVMYASLMNLTSPPVPPPPGTERLFQKKSAVFHQFAWRFLRIFEVSVFQGGIYKPADNKNRQQLDFWYFNPVIFASAAQVGLDQEENFMVGATFRADLFRTLTVYGQLMFDEIGLDAKNGIQAGIRYFNAFKVKHLHLRFEYNRVTTYSYANNNPDNAWTHYNQALAHPLGAGFSEYNFTVFYKWRDFFAYFNGFYANALLDTYGGNAGQDIFKGDSFKTIGLGNNAVQTSFDAHVGWMISYASNLNVSVGYRSRKLDRPQNPQEASFVYLSLRTSLQNTSFDFF